MNRNTELHFKNTPSIDLKRSRFEESHSHKTTFNVGDVIPVFVDSDILPGDTVQMDMAELVRMATPIYPIMDNLYMDIYWFFVPHRLVWDHWQEFWGENDDPWTQTTEYEIPQLRAPVGGFRERSIADYMGVPTQIPGLEVNALPFRAYAKIWNDWFRDENLKSNCHIYKDETTRQGVIPDMTSYDYVTGTELAGKPCKAAKMHDYFTSALPEPQKGPAVSIPIGGQAPIAGSATGSFNLGEIPVMTRNQNWADSTLNKFNMKFGFNTTANLAADDYDIWLKTGVTGQKTDIPMTAGAFTYINGTTGGNRVLHGANSQIEGVYPMNLKVDGGTKTTQINLSGAYADLSSATAMTINALRQAFALQKYYENAGLHGTRYIEYIRSVFGVTSSDARMQRAEYLGGQRIPINIDQIIQTSSTDTTSPQGNTAGFSCTINRDSMFTKSFEEHGTLMCMVTIRTEHTYQQGLRKMWTRKKWVDFYNPFFATLGEQPIYNEQIYAQGNATDKEAFGYQEAWAEYRYKENYVTSAMRSNSATTLDVWHFADDYSQLPTLSSAWIDEPYENVDRTIAVKSQLHDQFIADFFFKCFYTRPMPVYSVPGLIDHV